LDTEGRIDPALWKEHREACRIARLRPGQEDGRGHLVNRPGGGWAFHYNSEVNRPDDVGFHFADESLNKAIAVSLSIQSLSLTSQISCSTGSIFTSKPRLRHIASMTVFSASTSPEMAFSPSDFAYSMISCIRAQPSPLPLRSDRSRIAYSPVS